jgi:hypothetical protein
VGGVVTGELVSVPLRTPELASQNLDLGVGEPSGAQRTHQRRRHLPVEGGTQSAGLALQVKGRFGELTGGFLRLGAVLPVPLDRRGGFVLRRPQGFVRLDEPENGVDLGLQFLGQLDERVPLAVDGGGGCLRSGGVRLRRRTHTLDRPSGFTAGRVRDLQRRRVLRELLTELLHRHTADGEDVGEPVERLLRRTRLPTLHHLGQGRVHRRDAFLGARQRRVRPRQARDQRLQGTLQASDSRPAGAVTVGQEREADLEVLQVAAEDPGSFTGQPPRPAVLGEAGRDRVDLRIEVLLRRADRSRRRLVDRERGGGLTGDRRDPPQPARGPLTGRPDGAQLVEHLAGGLAQLHPAGTGEQRRTGQGGEDRDTAADDRWQPTELVNQRVRRLGEHPKPTVRAGPGLNGQGLQGALQTLQVAGQVVGLDLRGPRRVAGIVDLGDPALNALRALVVQHAGGPDRVGAEDLRQGGVALRLRQVLQLLAQLPGEGGDADELALRVVRGDPELFHRLAGLLRRVGKRQQHLLEAGAGVRPDQASVGERGEGAGGVLHGQAELGGDQPGLLQRHTHVLHRPLRLARAGGQQVRHVRNLPALQLEVGEGRRGDLRRVADTDLPSRRQVEGTLQTTAENVGGRHTGLRQLGDAVGRLRRRELGVLAGLQRSLPQLVDLTGGGVRRSGHRRHLLVEVRGHLHRGGGDTDQAQTEVAGLPSDGVQLPGLRRPVQFTAQRLRCADSFATDLPGELGDVGDQLHGNGAGHRSPLPHLDAPQPRRSVRGRFLALVDGPLRLDQSEPGPARHPRRGERDPRGGLVGSGVIAR